MLYLESMLFFVSVSYIQPQSSDRFAVLPSNTIWDLARPPCGTSTTF